MESSVFTIFQHLHIQKLSLFILDLFDLFPAWIVCNCQEMARNLCSEFQKLSYRSINLFQGNFLSTVGNYLQSMSGKRSKKHTFSYVSRKRFDDVELARFSFIHLTGCSALKLCTTFTFKGACATRISVCCWRPVTKVFNTRTHTLHLTITTKDPIFIREYMEIGVGSIDFSLWFIPIQLENEHFVGTIFTNLRFLDDFKIP